MKLSYGHSGIEVFFTKRFNDGEDLGNQNGYKVRVATDQDGVEQVSTILHELFHLFIWRNMSGLDDEEKIVNMLSDNLTEVLAKNPKFLDWIAEKLQE